MTEIAFDGPKKWNTTARAALADTFHSEIGERKMRKGVESGKLELWAVTVDTAPAGYLITEKLGNREIFVWCYQGRRFFEVSRALASVAVQRKIPHVGWFTFHKAAARRYRRFAPVLTETAIPGEMRFQLNSEALANGG